MAADSIFGTPSNGDSANLTRGMVVRISATNAVLRAQADSTAHLAGMYGIVLSGSVAPGGPVNAAPNATRCPVLLEIGLTPVAGQALYVSETVPGRCTNVAPVAPSIPFPIGFIENVGSYANDSFVFASVMVSAVSAADFAKLATLPAGPGIIGALYETSLVDFLSAPGTTYALNAPLRNGHEFIPGLCYMDIETRDAAVVTAPAFTVSQNGVALSGNFTLSAGTHNARSAPYQANSIINFNRADMTTFGLDIVMVTSGTGPTSFTGRVLLGGYYRPIV